jgi:hypothetical protein
LSGELPAADFFLRTLRADENIKATKHLNDFWVSQAQSESLRAGFEFAVAKS